MVHYLIEFGFYGKAKSEMNWRHIQFLLAEQ